MAGYEFDDWEVELDNILRKADRKYTHAVFKRDLRHSSRLLSFAESQEDAFAAARDEIAASGEPEWICFVTRIERITRVVGDTSVMCFELRNVEEKQLIGFQRSENETK